MSEEEAGAAWDGPVEQTADTGRDGFGQGEDNKAGDMMSMEELLDKIAAYSPTMNRALITKAFKFAEKAHEGQKRRSGEPYFIHPVGVASIIADMKLDTASIVTGLLHDTVEDTSASLELIEEEFGAEIAQLVDGVTKIGKIQFTSKEEQQAENFRKMVVAMARDIRVILVKLADRTHNIRTLKHVPPHKQKDVAKETLDLYAPLAHRLGIFWLKTELEDTSLRFLHPEIYEQLKVMVATKREQRQAYTEEVVQILRGQMEGAGLGAASVTGRAKHFYSIYQKMQSQGLGFDEVQDLIAFRVLVDDLGQCYQALGIVHSMWKPVPGRFKDYIALPKPNMYRSLHTTVIGPAGQRIEVQIRTREMHQVAEEGIAAHWMYKGESQGVEEARRFQWLRQLVEWVQQLNDPQEFLHYIKEDLFEKEVFVFSPKGHLYALPKGSSVIDFAYRVHSDLGNHCIGARVNGRMVPLKHQVNNGDTVEVIQSPNQTPHRDWLGIARTSKAQARIRQWIKQQQREKSVALGRELLEKELRKYATRPGAQAVTPKEYKEKLEYVLASLNLAEEEQLLAALGYGQLTVNSFIQVFFAPAEEETSRGEADDQKVLRSLEGKEGKEKAEPEVGEGVLVGGERNVLIGFCRHCNPLAGDEVKGVITRGRGIKVHRSDCEHLLGSDEERRVDCSWDMEAKVQPRPVSLEVECEDAPGMLASMSKAISSAGVNIGSVVLKKLPNGHGLARFEVMLSTAEEMARVTGQLQNEKGVLTVTRDAMARNLKGKKRRVLRTSLVPPNLMSDL
eukprot:CAMPEP_0177695144 /NCGR_PEP_ID=MMETSP0484_2-20121128/3304_1 /TAXON_ID=354590 /ORGANISM="Rhodomonas lens, Strain RHODO" /LENGTH=789 /DNA_ID=CAMNT_0019206057 /DNA_START=429 /DNA_END=2798 /DNA_ORIENTATION=+